MVHSGTSDGFSGKSTGCSLAADPRVPQDGTTAETQLRSSAVLCPGLRSLPGRAGNFQAMVTPSGVFGQQLETEAVKSDQ